MKSTNISFWSSNWFLFASHESINVFSILCLSLWISFASFLCFFAPILLRKITWSEELRTNDGWNGFNPTFFGMQWYCCNPGHDLQLSSFPIWIYTEKTDNNFWDRPYITHWMNDKWLCCRMVYSEKNGKRKDKNWK